jgi:ribonuclease HII
VTAGPVARGNAAARRAAPARSAPHLRHERVLMRDGARLVAGMDEVGRGSLAGPVSVGVVVVDASTRSAPKGVADSKLLTPAARVALLPRLQRWGLAHAVGHASADEIDELGIIAALRLAGSRALAVVTAVTGPVDAVLLDGSHDWLTPPAQGDLFEVLEADSLPPTKVHVRVKADRTCASVAAASVLAKCERDALMAQLACDHPQYRWDENKGYASPDHIEALREHGPCPLHRRSWRLPGVGEVVLADDALLAELALEELGDADDALDELEPGDDELEPDTDELEPDTDDQAVVDGAWAVVDGG